MDNKRLIRNSKLMIVMSLVIVFVLMVSFAWMSISRTSTVVNKISAGSLDLVFDETCEAGEECDGIHLEKTVPMSFRQGLTTKAYKFKLINNSASATDYTINMEDFYEGVTVPTEGKIVDSKIRYIILEDEETAEASNSKLLSDGRSIKTGTIEGNKTINYTLYVWIDSHAGIEVNNQIFSGRLSISAEQQTPTYEVSGVLTDDNGNPLMGEGNLYFVKDGKIITLPDSKQFVEGDLTIPVSMQKAKFDPTSSVINNINLGKINPNENNNDPNNPQQFAYYSMYGGAGTGEYKRRNITKKLKRIPEGDGDAKAPIPKKKRKKSKKKISLYH